MASDASICYRYTAAVGGPEDGGALEKFNQPCYMAYDPSTDFLYVTDKRNHRVVVYRCSDMRALRALGCLGPSPGQFGFPIGIAIDTQKHELFVSDSNRISVWSVCSGSDADQGGVFLRSFGVLHAQIEALAVNELDGTIYLADLRDNSIRVYSSEGQLTTRFGRQDKESGKLPGEFAGPSGMVIDPSSPEPLLWVADKKNNRVQRLQLGGGSDPVVHPIPPGDEVGHLDWPHGIAFNRFASQFIVSDSKGRVQVFHRDGKFIQALDTRGQSKSGFWTPAGVFVHPTSGDLYIVDGANHRIQVWTPSRND